MTLRLLIPASVLLLTACHSPPRLADSGYELLVTHRAGGLLAATPTPAGPVDAASAWSVRVRAFAFVNGTVDRALTTATDGLAVSLLDPSTEAPIRGASEELRSARAASDDRARNALAAIREAATDSKRAIEFHAAAGALPDVSRIRIALRDRSTDAMASTAVLLARRGDTARLGLQHETGRAVDDITVTELQITGGTGTLWIELPGATPDETLGVFVDVRPGNANDPGHRVAVAQFERQAAEYTTQRAADATRWTREDANASAHRIAWRALGDPQKRRNAMLALCVTCDGVATDLAISGSEEVLDEVTSTVLEKSPDGPPEGLAPSWQVEREAIGCLASRIDRGAASPAERGLLLRHYGEAAKFATDLAAHALHSETLDAFVTKVMTENRRLLASPDPASRVRAFDWLVDRSAAPTGFDPFASRDSRRAALREVEK